MNESERLEPVPEGTTSAIPGRDDANPGERDVLEGDEERPDRDVMGPATGTPERDAMGEPDPADPEVMGARGAVPDETLGDDPDRQPEP